MRKILVVVFVAVIIGGVFKVNAGLKKAPVDYGTDYKCLNECLASGHVYGFCKKLCSY